MGGSHWEGFDNREGDRLLAFVRHRERVEQVRVPVPVIVTRQSRGLAARRLVESGRPGQLADATRVVHFRGRVLDSASSPPEEKIDANG
jgi:hypothetical protein